MRSIVRVNVRCLFALQLSETFMLGYGVYEFTCLRGRLNLYAHLL